MVVRRDDELIIGPGTCYCGQLCIWFKCMTCNWWLQFAGNWRQVCIVSWAVDARIWMVAVEFQIAGSTLIQPNGCFCCKASADFCELYKQPKISHHFTSRTRWMSVQCCCYEHESRMTRFEGRENDVVGVLSKHQRVNLYYCALDPDGVLKDTRFILVRA